MLELDGIDAFYGDLQALRNVSLEVKENEIVGIIGANGAGKTTTLTAISGALRPRRGTIRFQGERIDLLPPNIICEKGISHVREGRRLFASMSVLENLEMGAYPKRARADKEKTIEFVFQLFPILKERRMQKAGTLSGGEQQMLAIGRGLMAKPKLLMLDEPSLGLSPILVKQIFETVKGLKEHGVTLLLVEQNVHQALELVDRGYVLETGSIVLGGTADELLKSERVKKSYMGI